MATGPVLRLTSRQTMRALEHIDLLELMTERLARATPPVAPPPAAPAAPEAEETAVEEARTGVRVLLPTAMLRLIQAAGLAALASRELVAPGVVTAAVAGSGAALRLHVEVLARYLPTLSHVALSGAIAGPLAPLPRSVLDQLEGAGIGLSTATEPRRAASGANLFVVAGPGFRAPGCGPLTLGALLVNATGRDLPSAWTESVDRVYVDDLRLLGHHRHREFVRTHLSGPEADAEPLLRHREGWYRHTGAEHGGRRVEADLAGVLAGTCPGRAHDDEILLVELLGTEPVDAGLAWRLCQAAAEHGLADRAGPA